MKIKLLHFFFFFLSFSLHANVDSLNPDILEQVAPYLLADTHPAKPFLDEIFSSQRVTLSKQHALAAGFILTEHQGQQTTVMRHSRIPQYVIKVYFDNEVEPKEWEHWIKRIKGAAAIEAAIKKRKYTSLFVVPKKWIYRLPELPALPIEGNYVRRHFVLIAEHMPILSKPENKWAYRLQMSRSKLKKLFTLITEVGMSDSLRPTNVPWTYQKQLAFLDTERFHEWPIDYQQMLEFLNPEMRKYWKSLIVDQKRRKSLQK